MYLLRKTGITALFFVPAITCFSWGAEPDGAEIIAKVNRLLNPYSSRARLEMVIYDRQGRHRTFVYDSWSLNHGEKNLVKYREPSRTRGQATLMLNHADDIWMYFPRTGRVRKLASHARKQKMEGSDFSYEDMGSGDSFIEDYQARRLNDETAEKARCYVVALHKKEGSDISYGKIIMWVRQDNFVPVRLDYYDESHPDEVYKRLIQSDIKTIDGIPTATRMRMENLADGTRTEITFLDMAYNQDIDENLFTERGMRQ